MGQKGHLKIVCTVVVNIILLVLYVCLFGIQCINKYLGDGVTIISHEERPTAINPPGKYLKNVFNVFKHFILLTALTIYSINPITKLNYKTSNITPCMNKMGDQYIHCMEKEAFSQEDIFPYGMKHLNAHLFYSGDTNGLIQSVKIDSGVISTRAMSTMKIQFNPNMSYNIFITDPLLQFANSNPSTVPRTILRMTKNSGEVSLFLKANI